MNISSKISKIKCSLFFYYKKSVVT